MKKIITQLLFIFITYTANAQWRESEVPGFRDKFFDGFIQIQFADSNTIYGYTSSNSISNNNYPIYKSVNGNDFEVVNIDFSVIRSLYALNKDTLMCAVRKVVNNTQKVEFKYSEDAGKTWKDKIIHSQKDTAFKNKFSTAVYFFDNQHGCVFGDTANGCQEIWTTADAGNTWNRIDSSNIMFDSIGYNNFWFQPVFADYNVKGKVYLYNRTIPNKMFIVSEYGNKWEERNLPLNAKLKKVAFKDSLNGVAIRDGYNNIAITNDGGSTWDTTFTTPDYRTTTISYAKPTAKQKGFYICGGYDPVYGTGTPTTDKIGSYVSFDDGKTWKILDDFNHFTLNFYNAEIGISTYTKDSDNPFPVRFFEGLPEGFSGINQRSSFNIKTYPNPCKDYINIELVNNAKIEIYNMQGILCEEKQVENGTIKLNIENLVSGTYFLKITDNNNSYFQKIIKQ